ncbi:MAG: hypothetical protein K0U98_11425 [Deltaproteobacteria bacterium]|nr:hypothetical protein [Deltaproteobacteria bacterium]
MDILAESRKARAWLREKPGVRLKTYRGMVSFLGGWLRRSNDRGSFSKRHAGSSPTHESSSSEGFLGRYLAALEDLEERHRTKKISTEIYESVRPEVEASQTDEALVKAMTRAKELR